MKIVFEPGDLVEIEDNMKASETMGACIVKLIKKVSITKWLVGCEDINCMEGETGIIDESYFHAFF